jgi:hypothetical protein
MVRGQGRVDNATFAAMSKHFTAPEIVEIAALVGVMQLGCVLGEVFALRPD